MASGVTGSLARTCTDAFENRDVCSEILGITMPATADKAVHYKQLALWFEQHGRHLDRLGFD